MDRIVTPELMDQPEIDLSQLQHALSGLATVNVVSLVAPALWRRIAEWIKVTGAHRIRILDVACGGGDVLCRLGHYAHNAGISFEGYGLDFNPHSLALAQARCKKAGIKAAFLASDVNQIGITAEAGFDIIYSSAFFHHLHEEEATKLLSTLARATKGLLLINDLRRTQWGKFLAYVGPRLLTRSKMAHFDGGLSAKAAFSSEEFLALSQAVGLKNGHIENVWPSRFIFSWQTSRSLSPPMYLNNEKDTQHLT